MRSRIKQKIDKCEPCQSLKPSLPKEPLIHTTASFPMESASADLFHVVIFALESAPFWRCLIEIVEILNFLHQTSNFFFEVRFILFLLPCNVHTHRLVARWINGGLAYEDLPHPWRKGTFPNIHSQTCTTPLGRKGQEGYSTANWQQSHCNNVWSFRLVCSRLLPQIRWSHSQPARHPQTCRWYTYSSPHPRSPQN